jgi:hypothetical protein
MGPDDRPTDGKPHAQPLGFGCVKGLEKALTIVFVDADPEIRH